MEKEDIKEAEEVSPGMKKQSIKDLSYALFMGATLDAKYKNIIIAERNKKICEFFSQPIA